MTAMCGCGRSLQRALHCADIRRSALQLPTLPSAVACVELGMVAYYKALHSSA